MILPHNIYVHVPFCASKCNYCAFFSRACMSPDWDAYSNEIINEIEHWAQLLGKIHVPTIFFGGGTPSLMPIDIFEKIISKIRNAFDVAPECEITLESNPGTIDDKKLNDFINAGVNRLSIGIQSFDNEKLKFLGRRHDVKTALSFLDTALQYKLRVSADFIYGLPNDTVDDVIKMCNNINALGLAHCSMYELTLEPNTPFGKMNLKMPSNETMADMYNAIDDILNIPRYEVSNYAAPGNECKHNVSIWDGAPYIGIGHGAAGRIFINNEWFDQMGGGARFEKISNNARAIERVITGLRMVRGIRLDKDIKKIINMEYVHAHPELLHQTSDGRIAVTRAGMLVLDEVLLNMAK